MNHIDDISTFIRALHQSTKFHALVIQSGPGWAKSSTVQNALTSLGINFHSLGSYTTALELYNTLVAFSSATIVVDDCAGIFSQSVAMAIIKAATWPSASGVNGRRIVTWRSTSEKAKSPAVEFTGKLILIVNSVPNTVEARAFLSRTLHLEIKFSPKEVEQMLLEAANNQSFYDDTELAKRVAKHLITKVGPDEMTRLNLRTLQVAYELAKIDPHHWPTLIDKILPTSSPQEVVRVLSATPDSVQEQLNRFVQQTGLSRRTFFTYRKLLGIHRHSH